MRPGIYKFILLLTLLPLLLTGCASRQSGTEKPEGQNVNADGSFPGKDWKVQFIELESGGSGKILEFAMAENGVYAAFSRTPEDGAEYPLYFLSNEKLAQTETKHTFERISVKIPGEYQPFYLFSDNGKKLYILASCVTERTNSYLLYTSDPEIGDLQCTDITAAWKDTFGEENGAALAAVDENGFVYVGMKGNECKLLVVQEDGSLVSILRQQDCELYDLTSVGARYIVSGEQRERMSCFRLTFKNRNLKS